MRPINNRKETSILNLKHLTYFLILLFIFVSCSTSKQSGFTSKVSESNSEKRSPNEIKSTSSLLEAKRLLLNGEQELAFQALKKSIHENPNNDAAYFEISRIAQYSTSNKALSKALEYGKKALKIDPDNIWYRKNLIAIYKRQKDYENAAKQAQIIVHNNPNTKENYYQLANMYIYAEDFKSALKVYADIEQHFGFEEGVILQQKQIYLKLGDYNRALKEIDKLIASSPNTKRYYGMAADIYMAKGQTDKAYEYLQRILEIDPNDGRVHLVLADYYHSKGDENRAFQEVKIALGTPSLEIDTKINVILKYFEKSDSNVVIKAQANELMDTLLVANPKSPKVMALKADMLNRDANYEEAILYFRKVIALDSSRYLVWEQMLLVEQRLQDYQAMANESYRALKLFPQQAILYYFSGQANNKLKNYKKAEEHLKMGLNFVFDQKTKSDFYSLLAEAEFRQHKFGPAEDHFSLAIKDNPLNALALKDYAYFLAYNEKELSKAKRLASTALEIKAEDADYIYTYAFVLFKLGETVEANKWITDGLGKHPENKSLQLLRQEVNKNE